MPASITATPAAKAALSALRTAHGDIVLHLTGGCCDARTPLVLDAADLKLGARDTLFGEIDGVKIYEMGAEADADGAACRCTAFVLDLVDGLSVGFSLEAAPGKRFSLRDAA
jgi:uncharacterized protein (DUF779 family)